MVEATNQLVIIDNGQDTIKVGFSGEEDPKSTLAPPVGAMNGGRVMNWDEMETAWGKAF